MKIRLTLLMKHFSNLYFLPVWRRGSCNLICIVQISILVRGRLAIRMLIGKHIIRLCAATARV